VTTQTSLFAGRPHDFHITIVMNKNTFGVLQTGTYVITNVKNGNNVIIPNDEYAKAPIISGSDPNSSSSKWNITLLSNGNYNIVNYKFGNSASTTPMATEGGDVFALRTRVQVWVIRETGINGNYLISTLSGEYFRGLSDDDEQTPLALASVPNNKINQWKFTRVMA